MSQKRPENFLYTQEHEWAHIENDDIAIIGITDFAQESLGEIVFVELPELGRHLNKDEAFGVVESIKSVSDLYAPVSGEVIAINEELTQSPETLNAQPFESWLVKIKMSNKDEKNSLLSADRYQKICEQ